MDSTVLSVDGTSVFYAFFIDTEYLIHCQVEVCIGKGGVHVQNKARHKAGDTGR